MEDNGDNITFVAVILGGLCALYLLFSNVLGNMAHGETLACETSVTSNYRLEISTAMRSCESIGGTSVQFMEPKDETRFPTAVEPPQTLAAPSVAVPSSVDGGGNGAAAGDSPEPVRPAQPIAAPKVHHHAFCMKRRVWRSEHGHMRWHYRKVCSR